MLDTKITNVYLSKLFGYNKETFRIWTTKEKQARLQALKLSAIFTKNGISHHEALHMAERIKELEAEAKIQESEMNKCADKLEALRGLGKIKG